MVTLITILVFVAVLFAFVAKKIFALAEQRRFETWLRHRLGTLQSETASLLRTYKEDSASKWEKLLAQSGVGWSSHKLRQRLVWAISIGVTTGLAFGGILAAIFMGVGATAAVPLWLNWQRNKRMRLCNQQMPQALEIMALALRAGHPMPSALNIAANEAPMPLGDELKRAVEEHDLGSPMTELFVRLGQRLDGCEAVNTFVVAMLVLQQTGGNLISVIDRIVENARARAQFQSKVRALTSESRSSAKIMGALPGLFIVFASLLDANYSKILLRDTMGNVCLAICIFFWGIGILWIRRLMREE